MVSNRRSLCSRVFFVTDEAWTTLARFDLGILACVYVCVCMCVCMCFFLYSFLQSGWVGFVSTEVEFDGNISRLSFSWVFR